MAGGWAKIALAVGLAAPGVPARAEVYEFATSGTVARIDGGAMTATMTAAAPGSATPLDSLTGPARARTILAAISTLSQRHELNPALVEAVAWEESRLHPGAISPKGAVGVMQLMPATAARMGIDPHDWRTNVAGGITLLASLLRRYDNDLVKALAAYNAGTVAVDKYHGMPPWPETRAYVAAVLERLASRAMQASARPPG